MLSNERRPRVLIAVNPRASGRMLRVLEGFAVERAATVDEVSGALQRLRFDLVIVGSHFDRSHGIEAIEAVLAQACEVPLVCVHAAPFNTPLTEASVAAFRAAAMALGADLFLDVLQFPDDDAGNARARAMLERAALAT